MAHTRCMLDKLGYMRARLNTPTCSGTHTHARAYVPTSART